MITVKKVSLVTLAYVPIRVFRCLNCSMWYGLRCPGLDVFPISSLSVHSGRVRVVLASGAAILVGGGADGFFQVDVMVLVSSFCMHVRGSAAYKIALHIMASSARQIGGSR